MTVTESVLPYSIEGFITDAEANRIITLIDAYKAANPDRLMAGSQGKSVHSSEVLSLDELVDLFEPQGRIDINTDDLPREVIDIVEDAYFRHVEDIRRAYPSATWPYGVTYVEYGPNQWFTPHADGFTAMQCAGFGVTLGNEFTGGEFCVETCGSNRFWMIGPDGRPAVAPAADMSSEWFRAMPRTQWSMTPRRGVAVFYGSALVHASKPVTSGRLRKVIAFMTNH